MATDGRGEPPLPEKAKAVWRLLVLNIVDPVGHKQGVNQVFLAEYFESQHIHRIKRDRVVQRARTEPVIEAIVVLALINMLNHVDLHNIVTSRLRT